MSIKSCCFLSVAVAVIVLLLLLLLFHCTEIFFIGIGPSKQMQLHVNCMVFGWEHRFEQILKTICLVEIKCELNCIAVFHWISHLHTNTSTWAVHRTNTLKTQLHTSQHIHSNILTNTCARANIVFHAIAIHNETDLNAFYSIDIVQIYNYTWKLHLPSNNKSILGKSM